MSDNVLHTPPRVGILTFHFARNYGAVLQCYALQQTLWALGFEAGVIDYRPRSIAKGYKMVDIKRFWGRTPSKFLRKTRRELQVLGSRRARFGAMEDFVQKRLCLVSAEDCDTVIVGSDQVWNPALTDGKMDRWYWGQALKGKHLISYAVSMENGLQLLKDEQLREALERFGAVSLREGTALERARSLRQDACQCCDPVLLPDVRLWKSLAATSRICEELGEYLLYYQVRKSTEGLEMAQRLSAARGLRLIILSAKVEDENSPEVAAASPEDFLALLLGASFVLTTSFHGCAFSVLLHRPFLALSLGDGRDSRIAGLLQQIGLQSRSISLAAGSAGYAESTHSAGSSWSAESTQSARSAGFAESAGSTGSPVPEARSGSSAHSPASGSGSLADIVIKSAADAANAAIDWQAVDSRLSEIVGPSREFLLKNIRIFNPNTNL